MPSETQESSDTHQFTVVDAIVMTTAIGFSHSLWPWEAIEMPLHRHHALLCLLGIYVLPVVAAGSSVQLICGKSQSAKIGSIYAALLLHLAIAVALRLQLAIPGMFTLVVAVSLTLGAAVVSIRSGCAMIKCVTAMGIAVILMAVASFFAYFLWFGLMSTGS